MKTIPAVFKSATFIFLAALLFFAAVLVSIAPAQMQELWFATSMLVVILSLTAGITSMVLRSK